MVAPAPSRRLHRGGGLARRRMRPQPVGMAEPGAMPGDVEDVLGGEGEPGQGAVPGPGQRRVVVTAEGAQRVVGRRRRCRRREVAHIRLRIPRATFPGRFPNPASPEPNTGRRTSLRRKAPGGSSGGAADAAGGRSLTSGSAFPGRRFPDVSPTRHRRNQTPVGERVFVVLSMISRIRDYPGRLSSAGCRVKVVRPRLNPRSGWASSATALARSWPSIITRSADLPTASP